MDNQIDLQEPDLATCGPPTREVPITIKWIYKIKTNKDGSMSKLKAKLVARGFEQRAGDDFEDTSPQWQNTVHSKY